MLLPMQSAYVLSITLLLTPRLQQFRPRAQATVEQLMAESVMTRRPCSVVCIACLLVAPAYAVSAARRCAYWHTQRCLQIAGQDLIILHAWLLLLLLLLF
jgi:hypothetical protein